MNLRRITLIFVTSMLEHQRIKTCLALRSFYYSGTGNWELVHTAYKSLWGHVHLKNQISTELFCQWSFFLRFPAERNCAVTVCEYCILARAKERLINTKIFKPLAKKEGAFSRDKLRFEILFQLINLFLILLVVYILVMGGSQVIVVFKEVLFIMIPLLVCLGWKLILSRK